MSIRRQETEETDPLAQPMSGEHPIAEPSSGSFPLRVEGPLDSLEDAWFSEEKPPSPRPSSRPSGIRAPERVEPSAPLGDSVADRWFR